MKSLLAQGQASGRQPCFRMLETFEPDVSTKTVHVELSAHFLDSTFQLCTAILKMWPAQQRSLTNTSEVFFFGTPVHCLGQNSGGRLGHVGTKLSVGSSPWILQPRPLVVSVF